MTIFIFVINFRNVNCKNYYLKGFYLIQHIFDKEALIKPKTQDRARVFNLVLAEKPEFALIEIFVLQFVNLILFWLYPLSTDVTFIIKYLNNTEHNEHPGGSDSGGLFGYRVEPSSISFTKPTAA